MIDVFAHRGLHTIERENTIAAFRAAVELGVDGVELDVRRTLDGVLVVHHDQVIGPLAIARSARSALPDYVPTLAAALESLEGVRVNVEIKNGRGTDEIYDETGELTREVLACVEASGWTERASISCFDLATCAVVRSLNRDITVAWLLWDVAANDALVQAHVLGLNAVNPHFTTVDADVVTRARDLHLDVNVWTVNRTEDLERMTEANVACIITDDPVLASSVVTRSSPTGHPR
ncbi:MAG TPA: glycerophosphodiester phosphodiesterase [Acidimicrobiales bacterium]|nr:glycerophosphodiester phosphodiesterase [Acidimicrobiales bacterium]